MCICFDLLSLHVNKQAFDIRSNNDLFDFFMTVWPSDILINLSSNAIFTSEFATHTHNTVLQLSEGIRPQRLFFFKS